MNTKSSICIASLICLAGCANAPQPMKIGKDTWMIDQKHSGGFFSGVSSAEQMKQAAVFCQSMGKELEVVGTQDPSLPAMWTHSHVVFNCFDKDDPRYREGNLRPDKGVQSVTTQ
jgi:hypothetical protein